MHFFGLRDVFLITCVYVPGGTEYLVFFYKLSEDRNEPFIDIA